MRGGFPSRIFVFARGLWQKIIMVLDLYLPLHLFGA